MRALARVGKVIRQGKVKAEEERVEFMDCISRELRENFPPRIFTCTSLFLTLPDPLSQKKRNKRYFRLGSEESCTFVLTAACKVKKKIYKYR